MSAVASAKSRRISFADACAIAKEIVEVLKWHCDKLICAGSMRRRKPFVADIEFLFIPRVEPDPNHKLVYSDFFRDPAPAPLISQVDLALDALLKAGLIAKRLNKLEVESWGARNKLGIHTPSGTAIDFFTATEENWFNYLVCRTGGAITNTRIASAALAKGWQWNTYGAGFTNRATGEIHPVKQERDVFEFVGLPYLEPWNRE